MPDPKTTLRCCDCNKAAPRATKPDEFGLWLCPRCFAEMDYMMRVWAGPIFDAGKERHV